MHPCRIPVPALSSAPPRPEDMPRAHQAWLLGVLDDRIVNGDQEFLCNWEGDSCHQWSRGGVLHCNDKLEEYAKKSGKALDWRGLQGEPNPLMFHYAKTKTKPKLLTYRKNKPRLALDWERKEKPQKRKTSESGRQRRLTAEGVEPARTSLQKASLPRSCKYLVS